MPLREYNDPHPVAAALGRIDLVLGQLPRFRVLTYGSSGCLMMHAMVPSMGNRRRFLRVVTRSLRPGLTQAEEDLHGVVTKLLIAEGFQHIEGQIMLRDDPVVGVSATRPLNLSNHEQLSLTQYILGQIEGLGIDPNAPAPLVKVPSHDT